MLFREDCLIAMRNRKFTYDYLLTSPPDLEEIGMPANEPGWKSYRTFLSERLHMFAPTNNVATIISTDRKFSGTILQKHSLIISLMNDCGWKLRGQKIWIRSYSVNLFRLNYTFVQTFVTGKAKINGSEKAIPDTLFRAVHPIGDYRDNFPVELIKPFVECYSSVGQTVFDPFIGSGTTAIVALETGRRWVGCETDSEIANLADRRIKALTS